MEGGSSGISVFESLPRREAPGEEEEVEGRTGFRGDGRFGLARWYCSSIVVNPDFGLIDKLLSKWCSPVSLERLEMEGGESGCASSTEDGDDVEEGDMTCFDVAPCCPGEFRVRYGLGIRGGTADGAPAPFASSEAESGECTAFEAS